MKVVLVTLDSLGNKDETYTLESNISPTNVEVLRNRLSEGINVKGDKYLIVDQEYEIRPNGNARYTLTAQQPS